VNARRFMFIAGEPSGDLLAAELVEALEQSPQVRALPFPLEFIGAGGRRMAEAGVELAVDLTRHSVVGVSDVLMKYWDFRRIFDRLFRLALEREPDVIICVDFSGFNRRFAGAIKRFVRVHAGSFLNWRPKVVQYVSPQVWASRPGRARQLERDVDLVLSIIPFEKEWYARNAPRLRVEFVGHPMLDRYRNAERGARNTERGAGPGADRTDSRSPVTNRPPPPTVLLLPGSRVGELRRHLPVMVDAVKRIAAVRPIEPKMILPEEELASLAAGCRAQLHDLQIEIGGLQDALQQASIVIASTGTVTLECAYFGVPTVALYKASWSSYLIARAVVTVRYLAMPNLLAGEEVYPEFIQHRATGENIARAALDLLNNPARREAVKAKLARVIQSLGAPGASQRAAAAVLQLLATEPFPIRGALSD